MVVNGVFQFSFRLYYWVSYWHGRIFIFLIRLPVGVIMTEKCNCIKKMGLVDWIREGCEHCRAKCPKCGGNLIPRRIPISSSMVYDCEGEFKDQISPSALRKD